MWVFRVYQERTAHPVMQALVVTLEHPDEEDLTDILAHLVLPVHPAQWGVTAMDIRERKGTRATLVFLVRAVSREMSL